VLLATHKTFGEWAASDGSLADEKGNPAL